MKLIADINTVRVKGEQVNFIKHHDEPLHLFTSSQSRRQQVRLYILSADSAGKPATLEMRSTAPPLLTHDANGLPFGEEACTQGGVAEEKYA